jgi:hypothetical protein
MEVYGGVKAWEETAEEEDLKSDSPRVKDTATYTITKFSKSIDIPKTFFDDAQHDVIGKMMRDFANKAIVARDKDAFGLFRGATTTTLTADGVVLGSNSHITVSGDTVDNLFTEALDDDALNTALIMLAEQKDQSGEIMGHEASVLLVPPALFKQACILTDSQFRPGTANNDTNVYSTKYPGLVVMQSNRLGAAAGGSDTQWQLLGRNHGIYRWVREGVSTDLVPYSYSRNDNYVYKGRFREETGAVSYEGVVVSTGLT